MSKLTLEIVPGYAMPPWLAGTDNILAYWISVTNDGGGPVEGLGGNFTVETLSITWPNRQRIVFNGGQAWERAPGYYIVGLLPDKSYPDRNWLTATYVLGIGVKRRRRWIGTDLGQAFVSFTVLWPAP